MAIKAYVTFYWTFFKMGLFTIGGGMSMIPLLQKMIVEDKKWLTDAEMTDCLAVSQSLPGVVAVSAATYTGKRLKGMGGAVVATLGVISPSFFIILAAARLLGTWGSNVYVQGAFAGIKAAVCALVVLAAYKVGKTVVKDGFSWVVAIGVFLAVVAFRVTAIWVILAAAAAGIAWLHFGEKRKQKGDLP